MGTYLFIHYFELEARTLGYGTMLKAGRSWVRFPIRSLKFFNWPNTSSRTTALGLTQPLSEISAGNFHGE
jgi:hypothetical protein